MTEWKRVKITFPTVKLGNFIEPIKNTVANLNAYDLDAYGVTNKEGIVLTGKEASADKSKYIVLEKDCFAFNPYRINVGSIGLNDKNIKGCVSPAYIVFKTKEPLLPKFLFHYLKSDYGNHLINWYGNRGGVRNALRYDDLCNIDIPDISNINQKELLNLLDKTQEKIDFIQDEIAEQKTLIKKLRQSILQDAIEGKLTEDWRKENLDGGRLPLAPVGKPSSATPSVGDTPATPPKFRGDKKMLAPITDKEKPFEIPESWKWVRLGEIIYETPKNGYSPKAVNYETKTKSLKLGAITWAKFDGTEIKYIDEIIPADSPYWLKKGDFLLQRSNSIDYVGICAIYTGKDNEYMYPDLMMRFRPIKNLNHDFIHKALIAPFNREYFKKNAKGSQQTMPKINQECVVNTLIPLPLLAEQNEIVRRVENQLAKVEQLEQQVEERENLTKSLFRGILKNAFEGK